jgi:hypothetical protein
MCRVLNLIFHVEMVSSYLDIFLLALSQLAKVSSRIFLLVGVVVVPKFLYRWHTSTARSFPWSSLWRKIDGSVCIASLNASGKLVWIIHVYNSRSCKIEGAERTPMLRSARRDYR